MAYLETEEGSNKEQKTPDQELPLDQEACARHTNSASIDCKCINTQGFLCSVSLSKRQLVWTIYFLYLSICFFNYIISTDI